MWPELRPEGLEILDPARTAGCKHRERSAVFDPSQKLCALLHDGEVGSEVRVEYLVESENLQCAYESSGAYRSGFLAECLREIYADRRSDLNDHLLL